MAAGRPGDGPRGVRRKAAGCSRDGRGAFVGWPWGVRGMAAGRSQDGRGALPTPDPDRTAGNNARTGLP